MWAAGIVNYLAALPHFGKFKISIRGISNKFFAIYNERGLGANSAGGPGEIAEVDPDSNLERLLRCAAYTRN